MLSGAVGGGKSFLGCWKGFLLNMMYPGNRGLICRKENSTLKESTMLTLVQKVIPKELIVSFSAFKGELVHRTPDPDKNSTIIFSGLDKRADQTYPTKIGSTEYGWIFVDEMVEIDKDDHAMLSSRLRYTPEGTQPDMMPRQLFGATNPDGPQHWAYQFYIESESEDREVVYITPYDNPYLPEAYIQKLEGSLTGVTRQRLLEGKWVRAEGVIYADFNPDKHVSAKDFLKLPEYKELIVGADSNYPLPRAAILVGVRGDGKRDILREFYMEEAHVEDLREWCEQIHAESNKTVLVYHDPSDPDAIAKLDEGKGVSCEKASNKVQPGISEVARHFVNDILFINPECKNLIKELQSYRWKPGMEKQAPLKENDHACDALRYALLSHKEGRGTIEFWVDTSGFF